MWRKPWNPFVLRAWEELGSVYRTEGWSDLAKGVENVKNVSEAEERLIFYSLAPQFAKLSVCCHVAREAKFGVRCILCTAQCKVCFELR